MTKNYTDILKKLFEKTQMGQISIQIPNSQTLVFKGSLEGPLCDLIIKDWTVIDMVIKRGDIGLGEAFCKNLWESSYVADFLSFCSLNLDHIHNNGSAGFLNKMFFYFYNKVIRINSKYGSKKNILEHYDIGNDFYSLWLDPTMTYSSSLRKSPLDTLQEAQLNKYQRIIERLSLKDTTVLEIGCGWGGFAEEAVKAGADVTGITISDNQYYFAKKRLGDKAKILLQDYRDVKKTYDRIVSIEMFEAVGERYWETYFNKIKSSLSKGGKALIQTITIRDDVFDKYKNDSDYIRHYIFPGGLLPSKSRFCAEVHKSGMTIDTLFEFGQDYAWTLRQWGENFNNIKDKLTALKYAPDFLRAWEFYLNISIAGFESGRTNVMQIEISH